MAEYASYPWTCLNILEYTVLTLPGLCICLIILHAGQAFEETLGSKLARVLNMARLYKGYTQLRTCLIMAPYTSLMPECASICLNVLQYTWTWLNIAECPWKCLNKLFRICQDSQCIGPNAGQKWQQLPLLGTKSWHPNSFFVSLSVLSKTVENENLIKNYMIFIQKSLVKESWPKKPFNLFNMSYNIRITKARKLLINFYFWLQWRQSFWSI